MDDLFSVTVSFVRKSVEVFSAGLTKKQIFKEFICVGLRMSFLYIRLIKSPLHSSF